MFLIEKLYCSALQSCRLSSQAQASWETKNRSNSREHPNCYKESISRSPRRSIRKHSVALSLSVCNVRRILHSNLKSHSYKLKVAQELLKRDQETCVACFKDIFENVTANAVLITSDEALFHLSGFVSKQNFCYWSQSNPRWLHERPLYSKQVTTWCAVANVGAWCPYFFEEEDEAVSITSARYVRMLQNFLKPKLEDLGKDAAVWF